MWLDILKFCYKFEFTQNVLSVWKLTLYLLKITILSLDKIFQKAKINDLVVEIYLLYQ